MATEIGKLYYDISVDDSKLKGQLDTSDQKVQGLSSSMKKMGVILAGAFSARAIYDFGKSVVTAGAQVEQWGIAFEVMTGSAETAKRLLSDIRQFAKVTPFNQKDLIEQSKQLMAYGFTAEKILPTINSLGNIAAGVGKDKLPQLTLALGQVRAAGKLTGMELRQFTEAGVPLLEELGKTLGKTAGEVKQDMEDGMAPSFETVELALSNMSKEGGKFHDLMQRQSKTTAGRWSNLQDTVQISMAEWGQKLLPTINKGLDYIPIALTAIKNGFAQVWPTMQAVGDVLQNTLLPSLKALYNTFVNELLPSLMRLWNILSPVLIPAITALGIMFGTWFTGTLWVIANVLNVIINIWKFFYNSIATGASIAVSAITYLGKTIASVFGGVKNTIINAFSSAFNFVQSLWGRITGFFGSIGAGIGSAISSAMEGVKNTVKAAVNWIIDKANVAIRGVNKVSPPGVPEIGEIPKLSKGIENFGGGLAYVHRGEVLTNLAPGSSVIKKSDVQGMMNAAGGGSGDTYNFNFSGMAATSKQALRDMSQEIFNAFNEGLRSQGKKEVGTW